MLTERNLVMAFQFSATKQEVRSFLINNEPFFVAKDVCNVLGISKYRDALSRLDDDERGSVKLDTLGGKQKTSIISESGLYALIMRSNKPEAKAFRKWVTSEVLPAIRKKGYFGINRLPKNFTDVRDVPYLKTMFNDMAIRYIVFEKRNWYSVTDIHKALRTSTDARQVAKRLNEKQTLAHKFWLFGGTNPTWFTTKLGFKLIVCGNRCTTSNQLLLEI